MHQQLKTEQNHFAAKKSVTNHKIESFILKSISEQAQLYDPVAEKKTPHKVTKKQKLQNGLPVITRNGGIALPQTVKQSHLFGTKQPKMSLLLHFQSQKLLQASRAKDEEQHLQNGPAPFHIQTTKLNHQSLQKLQRRGRYSLPSLVKQAKLNQLQQNRQSQMEISPLKKQLSEVVKQKQSERKQFYLQQQQRQTITGWGSYQHDLDVFH